MNLRGVHICTIEGCWFDWQYISFFYWFLLWNGALMDWVCRSRSCESHNSCLSWTWSAITCKEQLFLVSCNVLETGGSIHCLLLLTFLCIRVWMFVQMNTKTTKGKIESMERAKVLRDQGYLDDRHNQRVCLEQWGSVDWEDQSVEQLLLQWFSCPDKVSYIRVLSVFMQLLQAARATPLTISKACTMQ